VIRPVKFYTDEHVAKAIARGLRQRGVDAITAAEANLLGAADEQHLMFALSQDRVMFTEDEDFLSLHAAGIEHAGIVYAHQRTSIGEIIRGLMLVYQVFDADEMRGHVEFL
jgi:uncharacterized protein with PIN domain